VSSGAPDTLESMLSSRMVRYEEYVSVPDPALDSPSGPITRGTTCWLMAVRSKATSVTSGWMPAR
jgi:hypothetical protein